jgi:hypothetical protein
LSAPPPVPAAADVDAAAAAAAADAAAAGGAGAAAPAPAPLLLAARRLWPAASPSSDGRPVAVPAARGATGALPGRRAAAAAALAAPAGGGRGAEKLPPALPLLLLPRRWRGWPPRAPPSSLEPPSRLYTRTRSWRLTWRAGGGGRRAWHGHQ